MRIFKNLNTALVPIRILWLLFLSAFLFGCGSKSDADKLNFLQRGNEAFDISDFNNALRFYNEAINADSSFVDAWNNKGLTLMKLQRFDEAIYCFNKATTIKPEYGEALLNSARANLEVHQHFAALEQLELLARLWPDTSLIPFTTGLIYADMGKNTESIAEFKTALVKDSTNVESLINMANLYYQENELDTAIFCVERAMMIDANHPEAYNVLAMVYVEQEFYNDAYQTIKVAEAMGEDPYVLNNKSFILYKLDRLDEAQENAEQSMKMDPYNAWVYRNLGLIKEAKGSSDDAIRLLEKAYEMDNSIKDIHIDLARVYYQANRVKEACKILEDSRGEEALELKRKWCN